MRRAVGRCAQLTAAAAPRDTEVGSLGAISLGGGLSGTAVLALEGGVAVLLPPPTSEIGPLGVVLDATCCVAGCDCCGRSRVAGGGAVSSRAGVVGAARSTDGGGAPSRFSESPIGT